MLDDNDTLGVDAALAGVSKSVMLARKIKVLGQGTSMIPILTLHMLRV